MKKRLITLVAVATIALSSCKVKEVVSDAQAISGTYTMTAFNDETGSYDVETGDKIVVSKVDDSNVKVFIDFADASMTDITNSKMAVAKSGSNYVLSQTFSNAVGSGSVIGNSITITNTFNDKTYNTFKGSK